MKSKSRFRVGLLFATLLAVPLAASIAQAGSSPLVSTVKTFDCRNSTGSCTPAEANAFLDTIEITFAQGMDSTQEPKISSGPGDPGIAVTGYTIIPPMRWGYPSSSVPNGSPRTVLTINLAERTTPDTGATPVVTYTTGAGPRDLKTTAGVALEAWDAAALDGAGPVLLGVTAKDYGTKDLFNSVGDEMLLRFSEPVSLAGATPTDRWGNLERAVTFTTVSGQGMSCADGIGSITDRNFPRPQGATDDPIVAPAAGASADTVRVRYLSGNEPSTATPAAFVPALPVGCKTGIHASFNAGIVDTASNVAAKVDGARTMYTYPADTSLVSALTTEIGTPNGTVDGVRLSFDLPLDDATITANLSDLRVSVGGVAKSVTFDTGSAVNDGQFALALAGGTPDGGVTPRIAYTRRADCADTTAGSTGSGIKAFVLPMGGSHRSCLGAFDAVATDGVAPLLTGATTLDTNANGVIDGAVITFNEAIASGSKDGWTIDGAAATGFAVSGTTAQITVAENGLDGGATPTVAYAVPSAGATADAGGNGIAAQSITARDGAPPSLTGVTVRDLDADGAIDAADFRFTEAVIKGANAASAFSVGGVTATDVTTTGSTATATFTGLDGTAARAASFDPALGTVSDAAGVPAPQRTFAVADVVDGAAPTGDIEISPSAPVGPGVTTISGVFSENMDTTTAPTVTFAGRTVMPIIDTAHTAGWVNADPQTWEGTITVSSGDCTVRTGCEVAAVISGAKDTRTNAQAAPLSRTTEIDTIAPAAPTGATVTTTPAAPSGFANQATTGLTLEFPVAAGDASGGTAELLLDGTSFAAEIPVGAGEKVTLTKTFATVDEFRAAVPAGTHRVGVKLCDDAANCATTTDAASFVADYTAIPVTLTTTFADFVSGGTSLDLAWDGDQTATDLSGNALSYTTDGSTFTDISTSTAADGTAPWTIPTVDTETAAVRVTSLDRAGNRTTSTSEAFAIDSSAPVVAVTGPTTRSPFLSARETITWDVTDATVSQVAEPMVIEYSTDGGTTWAPINGGAYSKVNDGTESWTTPAGRSFDVRLRVQATDAFDRVGSASSGRLATGVRGFVADRGGAVYGFGSASTNVRETLTSSSDVIRGLAVRSNGVSGYTLSSNGLVYPFAEATATLPPRVAATRFSSPLARAIALRTDTSGYVVDAYGRVYAFGRAPKATASRTWVGSDLARGIVVNADKRGGYVLDATGKLHPFRVGSYAMPRQIQTKVLSSKRAVSVVLAAGGRSGYVLENTGRIIAFGGAPVVANAGTSSTAGARSLVAVTATGGYWIDGRGVLRAYGTAFGAPANTTLGSGRARGGAM